MLSETETRNRLARIIGAVLFNVNNFPTVHPHHGNQRGQRMKTLKGGRLELGRVWIMYAGWSAWKSYRIGSTRVFHVGPIALFVGKDQP